MKIKTMEISSLDMIYGLEKEWNALLQATGMDSPFLAHEWFVSCLHAYGEGKVPAVITFREEDRLVGIAPCWRYQDRARGVNLRRVGFIRCLDTPYCDLIIEPGHRQAVVKLFAGIIFQDGQGQSDIATFDAWSVQSPNLTLIKQVFREEAVPIFLESASVNPYLPLEGDWEAFINSKSQRFRKTYRNVVNRVRRLGRIQVDCMKGDPSGDLLKDIFGVSERGWKHQQGLAMTNSQEAMRFFSRLTKVSSEKGWLMVWLLRLDGEPIAMEFDLVQGGVVSALRSDFDEKYGEHSPGSYLEYEIMQNLFMGGFAEYNTGPGVNAYKLKWTDAAREHQRLHVFGRTMRGRLYRAIEGTLIPMLKRVRTRWFSKCEPVVA
ncbi:MAG: GNAT family N-acetyltransferase [Nitrospira sp.]|jgi:CelD/BcsL family acetyltransferase involved in cellulose biosynthesis